MSPSPHEKKLRAPVTTRAPITGGVRARVPAPRHVFLPTPRAEPALGTAAGAATAVPQTHEHRERNISFRLLSQQLLEIAWPQD